MEGMKNREIIEGLVMLENALRGFVSDIRTESGKRAAINCDKDGTVHMEEAVLVELFGAAVTVGEWSGGKMYPVEASYTYKGVKFFAIMTRERAKELFGYDAPPAPVPDSGGAQ
jgi:hypothetical protein